MNSASKGLLLSFCFFTSLQAFGRSTTIVENTDPVLRLLSNRLAELTQMRIPDTTPFVLYRGLEVGVEAESFRETPKYELSLGFYAWGERGALRRETEFAKQLADLKWTYEQNLLALDVYREIIQFRSTIDELEIIDEQIDFIDKKNEVLRNYVKTGKASIDDLLKSEFESIRLKTSRKQLLSSSKLEANTHLKEFVKFQLPEPATLIKHWIKHQETSNLGEPLNAQIIQTEQEKNKMSSQRSESARWRILDSIGVDIEPGKDLVYKATFNVPLGDEKDSEAYQERIQAETDLIKFRREKRQALDTFTKLEAELSNALEEYKILARVTQDRKSNPQTIRKGSSGSDPLLIVESKLIILENQHRFILSQRNATTLYLSWLAERGLLTQTPIKNHLALNP